MTYTATYSSTKRSYDVTINANNDGYGNVTQRTITAEYGTTITTSENTLTINGTKVTATPTTSDAQYTYTFEGWTFSNCGTEGSEEVRPSCTVTANFKQEVNKYTVTWKNEDGTVLETDEGVAYGQTPSYN